MAHGAKPRNPGLFGLAWGALRVSFSTRPPMNTRSDPAPVADTPAKGSKFVLQPDEGTSYWQPKPANGYSTVKVSPDNCSSNQVTMGIQVVAPGGYVRD